MIFNRRQYELGCSEGGDRVRLPRQAVVDGIADAEGPGEREAPTLALMPGPPVQQLERLRRVLRNIEPSSSASPDVLNDAVIGLREVGTRAIFPLRSLLTGDGGEASAVRIELEHGLWRIRDPDRIAGLRSDGISSTEVILVAGAEISIGPVTMVAESATTIALRQYCARLLGHTDEALVAVEKALRSLRWWKLRRAPLYLRGAGDLMQVAQALHVHMAGHRSRSPFIASDARRNTMEASVRSPTNIAEVTSAIQAAHGGTLCVHLARLPMPVAALLDEFGDSRNQFRLTICAAAAKRATWMANCQVIDVPSPHSRPDELDSIVDDYLREARVELNVPRLQIGANDRDWIRRASSQSIPDLEKAAMRVTAIRATDTIKAAAESLGMAAVSLTRWLRRRSRDFVTNEPLVPPGFEEYNTIIRRIVGSSSSQRKQE